MNSPRLRRVALSLLVLTLFAARAAAQSVAPAAANATTKEDAVVLSPFEVNASDDKGYAASTALAGTRGYHRAQVSRDVGVKPKICWQTSPWRVACVHDDYESDSGGAVARP